MSTSARRVINVGTPPVGPYSQAVAGADLIYLSGVVAEDANRQVIGRGDVATQTREVIGHLRARLDAAGSSLEQVVCVTVYLKSASDFAAMNGAYRPYWPKDPPTRTTVIADLVLPDALVEIAMVAASNGADRTVIHPPDWQPSPNPYSYAIRTGDTLFLSGLVSRNGRDNSFVSGDVPQQTRVVLDSAGELLKAAGMTHADVVSARVFLPDATTFNQMNVEYRKYFTSDPPVRATVSAGLAGPQALVEMTFIASSSPHEVIEPDANRNPNLSAAIVSGRRVYLSGMLGNLPTNNCDAGAQTTETLARIRRALEAAGCTAADVVDSLVYLPDLAAYSAMNDAYRRFFGDAFPARATVASGLFAPDGLVEIMMTAVKP
jgi:enamine deaminase RidA (YjgF/YER057c/UK114 family)